MLYNGITKAAPNSKSAIRYIKDPVDSFFAQNQGYVAHRFTAAASLDELNAFTGHCAIEGVVSDSTGGLTPIDEVAPLVLRIGFSLITTAMARRRPKMSVTDTGLIGQRRAMASKTAEQFIIQAQDGIRLPITENPPIKAIAEPPSQFIGEPMKTRMWQWTST
ncbi:hypothetical protein FKW77_004133 [Venturia effusa]|uniref:Uncharacterized protein n=1 Tax=Venturia effusa TaxID=50376 RepID=A0A517LFC0_9PEZI|nr:hypothetical protein FKW77_004133 [Venturia effusa]